METVALQAVKLLLIHMVVMQDIGEEPFRIKIVQKWINPLHMLQDT